MAKIKVLHLITEIERGGAEILLTGLLGLLAKDNYDVCVGYLRGQGTLLNEFKKQGISAYSFRMRSRYDFFTILKLAGFMRKNNFDIVHTHLIDADIYGFFAAKLAGVPIVISTKHNTDNFRKRKTLAVSLDSFIANRLNKIFAVSNAVRDFLIKYQKINPKKIEVIYNGIDVEKFLPKKDKLRAKTELNLNPRDFIVGTVARFDEQKGQAYLIEAIPQVVREIKNVQFLLVGDGPLKKQAEEKAASLGLENKVKFLNSTDNILEILNALDLFVLPSLWEGFGIVLLEAQAAGIPVLASDVDGIREVVRRGVTGILVPAAEPVILAENIINLLKNENLRNDLSKNGSKFVKDNFTIELMAKRLETEYANLIKPKNV